MTLLEFVAGTSEGKEIFPNGLPDHIDLPDWNVEGPTEMDFCMREIFIPFAQNPGGIDLNRVMWAFNCIGFMNPHEAFPWIPVWMCASYYALTLEDYNPNTEGWTASKIEKCLNVDLLPVSIRAIEDFIANVLGGEEDEEEIVDALNAYKARSNRMD